ncbi:hypothetical protein AKJ09_06154 [Labilithrix luteola]|uniref:Uncharacterized protein n=1 Tax=Labilithrix luteola TaxID=1391654 RepID=A0A0K1Q127_9BACT|nr:hypothetical protein AKJ09_06154 [Labilithrix luteola]
MRPDTACARDPERGEKSGDLWVFLRVSTRHVGCSRARSAEGGAHRAVRNLGRTRR